MRPRKPSPIALLLAATLASPAVAGEPQVVSVIAADEVVLKATYWSAGKPGPGVLLLHMCNSDRSAWSGLGPLLAARGIHALALDYRGYGESGGEQGKEFAERQRIGNEIWPGDIDAAFENLRSKLGVTQPILGAAGGSCGVNQAVLLASRHPEVRSLALLAGGTSAAAEQFLAATPWMPLLGVSARDDGGAVAATRWVLGFSGGTANELKEYADGGHGTEIFAKHADLEPAIADWFERHLIRQPVRAEPPSRDPKGGPSAAIAASFRQPGGVAELRTRLAAAKARGEAIGLPPEPSVNLLGYEALRGSDTGRAIELFELNVELYPESANAYDSLADGFVAAGKTELAIANSRRAIALLPADPTKDNPGEKAIRESAQAKLRPAAPPAKP